jgi:hypothetical protein
MNIVSKFLIITGLNVDVAEVVEVHIDQGAELDF